MFSLSMSQRCLSCIAIKCMFKTLLHGNYFKTSQLKTVISTNSWSLLATANNYS